MTTPVLVPRSLIRLLDRQIKRARERVVEAERRLAELVEARKHVEPLEFEDASDSKARGGLARAESLTPSRRQEIARAAANKRWSKKGARK